MSQRGSRRKTAHHNFALHWGHYIRSSIAFSLVLILAPTFILSAQDTKPPEPFVKKVTLCVDGATRQLATQQETCRRCSSRKRSC